MSALALRSYRAVDVRSLYEPGATEAHFTVFGPNLDTDSPRVGSLCMATATGCSTSHINMTAAECRRLIAALSAAADEAEADAPVPAPRFEAGREFA